METKKCCACAATKPVNEFYPVRDKAKARTHQSRCKYCSGRRLYAFDWEKKNKNKSVSDIVARLPVLEGL